MCVAIQYVINTVGFGCQSEKNENTHVCAKEGIFPIRIFRKKIQHVSFLIRQKEIWYSHLQAGNRNCIHSKRVTKGSSTAK